MGSNFLAFFLFHGPLVFRLARKYLKQATNGDVQGRDNSKDVDSPPPWEHRVLESSE